MHTFNTTYCSLVLSNVYIQQQDNFLYVAQAYFEYILTQMLRHLQSLKVLQPVGDVDGNV